MLIRSFRYRTSSSRRRRATDTTVFAATIVVVDRKNSPMMSTEIGRRRRKTDCCVFVSLSTKDTLRSISLFFEAIKRLNVSRCGGRTSIAPLTRSRLKAKTDRSPVTRTGKSSWICRVGHPIDMETDIDVASWPLLDGRPPYSENSRTDEGPYRQSFLPISRKLINLGN